MPSEDYGLAIDLANHIVANNLAEVERLIQAGANPGLQCDDELGYTAMHYAASYGRIEIMEYLLANAAPIDIKNRNGQIPLHVAAKFGQMNAIIALEKNGSDLNLQEENACGYTAMHLAAENGYIEIMEYLLANGARIDVKDRNGQIPLHVAVQFSDISSIICLVRRCSAISLQERDDKFGYTPIHYAAKRGNIQIMKCLIANGTPIDIQDTNNNTPLHIALENRQVDTVKYLKRAGANPNLRNNDGYTPKQLMKIIEHKHDVSSSVSNLPEEPDLGELIIYGAPFNDILSKITTSNELLVITPNEVTLDNLAHGLAGHKNGGEIYNLLIQSSKIPPEYDIDLRAAVLSAGIIYNNQTLLESVLHDQALDFRSFIQSDRLHLSTPLGLAIKYNSAHTDLLLNHIHKYEPNIKTAILTTLDEDGMSSIHYAAASGQIGIIEYLLDNGVPIDIRNKKGMAPLHIAAQFGQMDALLYLQERKADLQLTSVNEDGMSSIHYAAACGKIEIIEYLLDNGVPIDIQDKKGMTPLHIAARFGQMDALGCLKERNAYLKLHSRTEAGYTAMHIAARYGQIRIIEYLLDNDVPIDIRDKKGMAPLHIAAQFGQMDALRYLQERKADLQLTSVNEYGMSSIHYAAACGKIEIIEYLLDNGVPIDIQNKKGMAPLHIAVQFGQMDALLCLKERKADLQLTSVSEDGMSSIHYAAACGQIGIMKYLLDNDVPIDIQDKNGDTPLHVATKSRQVKAITYLKRAGANPTLRNNDGYTPAELRKIVEHKHDVSTLIRQENKSSIDLHYQLRSKAIIAEPSIDESLIGIFNAATSQTGVALLDTLLAHFATDPHTDEALQNWLKNLKNKYFNTDEPSHPTELPAFKYHLAATISLHLAKKIDPLPTRVQPENFACLAGTTSRMGEVIEGYYGSPELQYMNAYCSIEARKLVDKGQILVGTEQHATTALKYLFGFLTHEEALSKDPLYRSALNIPPAEIFTLREAFYQYLNTSITEYVTSEIRQIVHAFQENNLEEYNEKSTALETKLSEPGLVQKLTAAITPLLEMDDKETNNTIDRASSEFRVGELCKYITSSEILPSAQDTMLLTINTFLKLNPPLTTKNIVAAQYILAESIIKAFPAEPNIDPLGIFLVHLKNEMKDDYPLGSWESANIDKRQLSDDLRLMQHYQKEENWVAFQNQKAKTELSFGQAILSDFEDTDKTFILMNQSAITSFISDKYPVPQFISYDELIESTDDALTHYEPFELKQNIHLLKNTGNSNLRGNNALLQKRIAKLCPEVSSPVSNLPEEPALGELIVYGAPFNDIFSKITTSNELLVITPNEVTLDNLAHGLAGRKNGREIYNSLIQSSKIPAGYDMNLRAAVLSAAIIYNNQTLLESVLHDPALDFRSFIQSDRLHLSTPLGLAIQYNSAHADLLLDHINKYEPNIKTAILTTLDENGMSPMHIAAEYGKIRMMEYLRDNGVPIDIQDRNGHTPLHIAATYGKIDAAQWLRQSGLDLTLQLQNESGFTPMHLAAGYKQIRMVEYLRDNGVSIDIHDKHGRTPLHFAAFKNNLEMVTFLLKSGAVPSLLNNISNPSILAEINNYKEFQQIATAMTRIPATDRISESSRSELEKAIYLQLISTYDGKVEDFKKDMRLPPDRPLTPENIQYISDTSHITDLIQPCINISDPADLSYLPAFAARLIYLKTITIQNGVIPTQLSHTAIKNAFDIPHFMANARS